MDLLRFALHCSAASANRLFAAGANARKFHSNSEAKWPGHLLLSTSHNTFSDWQKVRRETRRAFFRDRRQEMVPSLRPVMQSRVPVAVGEDRDGGRQAPADGDAAQPPGRSEGGDDGNQTGGADHRAGGGPQPAKAMAQSAAETSSVAAPSRFSPAVSCQRIALSKIKPKSTKKANDRPAGLHNRCIARCRRGEGGQRQRRGHHRQPQ